MAFELVSWTDFKFVLNQFSSRTRLERSWGSVWPENDRKSSNTKIWILVSYYDRYYVRPDLPRVTLPCFVQLIFPSGRGLWRAASVVLAVLNAIPPHPGEGPDCQFPEEIEGFGADSGLDPG